MLHVGKFPTGNGKLLFGVLKGKVVVVIVGKKARTGPIIDLEGFGVLFYDGIDFFKTPSCPHHVGINN